MQNFDSDKRYKPARNKINCSLTNNSKSRSSAKCNEGKLLENTILKCFKKMRITMSNLSALVTKFKEISSRDKFFLLTAGDAGWICKMKHRQIHRWIPKATQQCGLLKYE